MMCLIAAAMFLAAPQDPPKVTYVDSGDFRLLVMDLERRFKGRARFERGLASKEVSVSVKDAGYFEVLDALCRAHKEATYFSLYVEDPRFDDVKLAPGTWIEFPGSYYGHFKTTIVGMARTVRGLPEGVESRVQIHLAFHSPPWLPIGYTSGSRVEFNIEEALAPDGRDIRMKAEAAQDDLFYLDCAPDLVGPVQVRTLWLQDVDLSKGLKLLRGTFTLKAAESRVRRLEATPGSVLETPIGRLTVDKVKEAGRSGDAPRWSVVLTYLPKEPDVEGDHIFKAMEGRVLYEGLDSWRSLDLHGEWKSVEFETIELAKPPRWIELRIRGPERTYEVPFKFSDLLLKEGKR